jgi:hypothetical protein
VPRRARLAQGLDRKGRDVSENLVAWQLRAISGVDGADDNSFALW